MRLIRHCRIGFGTWATVIGIGPAFVVFMIFLGIPVIETIQTSFTKWDGVSAAHWIGWANYRGLFGSGGLGQSLWLTAKFAGISAVAIVLIATALAVAAHAKTGGSRLYQVIWFLPAIAPGAAVGVFWQLAFQPNVGIVNALLGAVGLGNQHVWLSQPGTALYPPILASVWAGAGLAYLLILGAINGVPDEVYEAATLDGASGLRKFASITLPLIRPVLITTLMLEVIWSANGFTLVWAMTTGGPGVATNILPVYIYRRAFQVADYGGASAAAVVGGFMQLAIGLAMLRLSASRRAGTA